MNKPKFLLLCGVMILLLASWAGIVIAQEPLTSNLTATLTPTRRPSITPFPTATYSPAIATAIAKGECLQSFSTFAYQAPSNTISPQMTPSSPWVFEAAHPLHEHKGQLNLGVSAARSINGHQEIWVLGGISEPGEQHTTNVNITIYHPQSRTWEFIPSEVENTDTVVGGVYVAEEGTVWGWSLAYQDSLLWGVPILSRFNESTRRFEFVERVLQIPLTRDFHVLEHQGIFWIFVDYDGLYSYDPATATTQKWADLREFDVNYTALSPDGSIYFDQYRWRGDFRLAGDELYQFFPETGEIVSVNLPAPEEEWPRFAGLLVDHTGRLWLGSVGYRDVEGAWHLMHDPEEYFNIVDLGIISYVSAMPYPILESSDGIIWFQKNLDTGGKWEGTAWYDPNTGEGCLITSLPTSIVEDSEQQLWMIADRKLFVKQLGSD